MKYLLLFLILTTSTFCHSQILYDYERGPSIEEIKDLAATKYSFSEGWFKSTASQDHTVTVLNEETGIRSSVIYLRGSALPEFILENLSYTDVERFINSLYPIGFRRVSSDTWIRPNGDLMVLHDNRGKPGEVHPSHEMLAFFSLNKANDPNLP